MPDGDMQSEADTSKDGDGSTLAKYDCKGIYFQAKLTGIHPSRLGDNDVHLLQIKLHFMKSWFSRTRYRGASVDLHVRKSGNGEPRIIRIAPEASTLHVSDLEVTTGESVTVGGGGNGGPANLNVNLQHSAGKKTSYKGVRLIHGVIKDSNSASWKFYEESASETGLPPVIYLLLAVCCDDAFSLDLDMYVLFRNSWGIMSTKKAPKDPKDPRAMCPIIPSLEKIDEKSSEEMVRKVQQLLTKAKSLTDHESKRIENFTTALDDHLKSRPNDAEDTIISKILDAKKLWLSDSEADLLLMYYSSIKRNNRDKEDRKLLAGESWVTSLGFLEEREATRNSVTRFLENVLAPGKPASSVLLTHRDTKHPQVSTENGNEPEKIDNLQETIELAETCLRETLEHDPSGVGKLSDLSRVMQSRYKSRRNPEDLEQAIKLGTRALELTPPHQPDWQERWNNLGVLLKDRYERSGATEDLNRAFEMIQHAMNSTTADDPDRARKLGDLVVMLGRPSDGKRLRRTLGTVTEAMFDNFNPVGPGYKVSRLS